jgi:hypothetical protein
VQVISSHWGLDSALARCLHEEVVPAKRFDGGVGECETTGELALDLGVELCNATKVGAAQTVCAIAIKVDAEGAGRVWR